MSLEYKYTTERSDENMPIAFPKDNWPIENPAERHLPAAVILDVVGKDECYIENLIQAFNALKDAIEEDSLARGRLELCLITNLRNGFVQETFRAAIDYLEPQEDYIANIFKTAQMQLDDDSRLDGSLQLALNLINSRLEEYREIGITNYQPWIFVFSDGKKVCLDQKSIGLFKDGQNKKNFRLMPVCVGSDKSSILRSLFSDSVDSYLIEPTKESFCKTFSWWAKSMCVTSRNVPVSIPEYLEVDSQLTVEEHKSHIEKESYSEKWVANVKQTAMYIDVFMQYLKDLNIEYHDTYDEDIGSVLISLRSDGFFNRINICFMGKTVAIIAEDKWEFYVNHFDKYDFGKYKLLKSIFESDLRNERMLVSFEHITYLHAEPEKFSEYLLMVIKKFDAELRGFVESYYISMSVSLPPTPSIVSVGI